MAALLCLCLCVCLATFCSIYTENASEITLQITYVYYTALTIDYTHTRTRKHTHTSLHFLVGLMDIYTLSKQLPLFWYRGCELLIEMWNEVAGEVKNDGTGDRCC